MSDKDEILRLGIEAKRDLEANEFWFLKTRDRLKERMARLFERTVIPPGGRSLQEEVERTGAMLAVLTETHQELLRTIAEADMQQRMDENDNAEQ